LWQASGPEQESLPSDRSGIEYCVAKQVRYCFRRLSPYSATNVERGLVRARSWQASYSLMSSYPGDRPSSEPIAAEKVAVDRKLFFLDLKENQRGRFLKITEDVGGRRDTIMLPAEAFRDFLEALQRLVEFESKL
jgi:hypothetical protein